MQATRQTTMSEILLSPKPSSMLDSVAHDMSAPLDDAEQLAIAKFSSFDSWLAGPVDIAKSPVPALLQIGPKPRSMGLERDEGVCMPDACRSEPPWVRC